MGYKVQPGDSWESIAGKVYGDQRMFAALANLNGWVMLQPGMEIELAEPQSDPYVGQSDIENANRLASYYGTEPYATYDELMTGGGAALPAVPTIPGVTEGETAPGGELFQTPGAVAPGAEPLMPAENLGVAGAGAGNVLPARPLSTAVTEELGTAGGTQAGQQLVSQALSTPPTTDPWARVEELRAAKAIPSEPAVTGGKVQPSLVPEGPTEPTLLPGISPYKPAPINKGPLDSLKNFTQSLVQDARRAWEQLAAETSSKYNDVPSTVGLAPEIPSWEGLNWFTALDLALPPIGAAVRLSRVWGQLENPVADILSGKFKEVLEADLQANPNIAPLLRNTITGAWSWLEGQEESKDLRASDLSRVSRGIATAIEVVGKMFSQGAIGLERLAGTIAIGLRENLPIKFEAHKIVEEWRFSPWYIDIAAQESANITINEAWQASRIMYSSIFDEAPVHEFIRELQAGEDPLLLQRKYMNPMAEMVGQTIFDPGWVFDIYNVGRVTRWVNKNLPVINIPLIGKRQLAHGTRLDRAADASRAYVLLDPNSIVTKGRQIFLDPNQAAKAGDGLMMMVNGMADAAKKHAQDLVTYVRKRGLFDIQAGGRAFDLWTEATETLMHLARNSSPEDFLRNLTAYISMTVDGSTVQQRADAIKLLLPNLMFSHLASDQGIRTGQVLADMFLDSAGKLDPTNIKWLLDQVIEVKKLPTKGEQIAELMKRLGPRVEASTIRINPDIVQRVKIQDEIAKLKAAGTWDSAPTWMKRFEGDKIPGWLRQLSTFDYYARKMVYAPINNMLSHVFMGLSLPYGIRNYQQDSFLIFVDRPSAFFASRRNMEALTKGILGALPEKAAQQFGGAVAALTTKTGTKKLFGYAIAGWAEAKSSMKIFGRTLEEVMIGAHEASAKTTRSLLQGRFTEAEIDTIVALQRKHQFDPYEAIKAFAGPEQTRRILVADPGKLRQLDAFPGLRDALQSALDDATDALDFERRSQLELAKQERLADAVSGEEVMIPPESNLGQELAKAGEHGTGWSVDLLARRNIAAEVAMEYQRQGFNKFCDAIAEATKGLPEGPQIEAALSKIQADTTTRVALAGADETRAANLLVEEVKKRYDAAQQSGASRDVLNGIWEEWRRLEGSRDTLHVEWRTRRLEIMQNGIVAAAKVHPEGQRILSAGFGPLDTANIVLETVLQMDDCDPILFAMTGRMYRTATGRPALDLMDEFGMPYTTRGGKPRPRPDGSLAPGAQPGILLKKEGLATSVNKYLPEDGSIRPFTPSELLSKDPAVWTEERLAELRTVLQRRNAVRGKTIAESVDEAAQFAEEGRKTEEFITSSVAAHGLDDVSTAGTPQDLFKAIDEAGIPVEDADLVRQEKWKKEAPPGGKYTGGAWAEYDQVDDPVDNLSAVLAKNDLVAHSTDELGKVEGIMEEGLFPGSYMSGPTGQGTSGPYVLVWDRVAVTGEIDIPHNPGDFKGSIEGRPRAIIVDTRAFPELKTEQALLDEFLDAEKALREYKGGKYVGSDGELDWGAIYKDEERRVGGGWGSLERSHLEGDHELRVLSRKAERAANAHAAALEPGYKPRTYADILEEAKAVGEKYGVPVVEALPDDNGALQIHDFINNPTGKSGKIFLNPELRNQDIATIRMVLTHEGAGHGYLSMVDNGELGSEAQARLRRVRRRMGWSEMADKATLEHQDEILADAIGEYFSPNRQLLMEGKSKSGFLEELKPSQQKALYQYVAKEATQSPELAALGGSLSGMAKPVVMGPDGVPLTPERPIVGPDIGPAPSGARAIAENETGMRALVNSIIDDQKKIWDQRAAAAVAVTPERRQALQQWAKVTARNMEEAKVVATTVAGRARDWALHSYPSKRGFDHVLSYVYPYHFWYTRTYSKMMLRMTRSPGYLATWARYRNFVQNEHAGLPEWWKNNISSDMFGISPQNPFYFNLESSINPLNGLTGIDFNDPNRRITAVSRTLDDLGKFGPTPWLPYQLFMGIGSALWGPKEQARAWLGNRLLPQSQLIKSATHLMGISAPSSAKLPFLGPGGLEIDPFVLLFEQGKGTPFEQNRIGRALGDLEQEQKITHEQALEAARLKEGTVWDMAIERAASERDWSNVIAGLTSAGLKARSQSEMMIDIAYTTAAMLRASKANMSPEQYSAKWAKFYADYPWMEAVMIGRAVGIDADEAYAWNVFSRIPPGQSREWAEAAKIDPEMLQRFYDTKGDLTKFNELDRKDFMVAIEKLGATLSTPADSTRGEWELARSQYKAFFGAPPDIRKKEIYYNNLPGAQEREEYLAENPDLEKWFNLEIGVDTFYREQGKDPKLGAKFLEDNPDVAQYLAYREQTILADPILFKYYGGIDFVEKSWRRGMYAEAEKLFGEDIFDIQTAYFEVKENGWDLRSFKAQHPQLLEYWDWLHARKAELELRLAEIDDLMPETVKASIRPDAPEDSLSIQAILEGLKETAPAIDTPSDLALQYMTKPEEEGGDFSITAYLDTEAEKMWPGVLADLQEWQRLNAENPFAAKTFRASHPDLVEYQRWEKAERKKYNALNAGKPARLNAVTVSWSEWQQAIDPEGDGIVPRLIIDHFRGKALSADLKKRLEGLWIVMGRPMGSFEKWLSTMKSAWAVTPTY